MSGRRIPDMRRPSSAPRRARRICLGRFSELRFRPRRRRTTVIAAIALVVLVFSGIAGARGRHAATSTPPSPRQQQFAAAAREFAVPEPLLLALSYVQARWEDGRGAPTDAAGGFGPLHLTLANGHA